MKLAIIGLGKMGRLIDRLAPDFGFTVQCRIGAGDDMGRAKGADVAIEFTTPSAVVGNIEQLAAFGVPVVVGTTGWNTELDRVRAIVGLHDTALVWSPNFSIGVHVFAHIVREAARLLASEPQYGAWGWEIHHEAKKDAPSGTLSKLVEEMRAAGYAREISIASSRAGTHPGTHEIGFDSAADTMTLRHSARNRDGFALGALKAAQWISGKKGVFEFGEILFAAPELT